MAVRLFPGLHRGALEPRSNIVAGRVGPLLNVKRIDNPVLHVHSVVVRESDVILDRP